MKNDVQPSGWGKLSAKIMLGIGALVLLSGYRYRTVPGDTVHSIAAKHDVTAHAIRVANPDVPELFTGGAIASGQVLTIPELNPLFVEGGWSPERPLEPPRPTVSELRRHIARGTVRVVPPEKKGLLGLMIFGLECDDENGRTVRFGTLWRRLDGSVDAFVKTERGKTVHVGRVAEPKVDSDLASERALGLLYGRSMFPSTLEDDVRRHERKPFEDRFRHGWTADTYEPRVDPFEGYGAPRYRPPSYTPPSSYGPSYTPPSSYRPSYTPPRTSSGYTPPSRPTFRFMPRGR